MSRDLANMRLALLIYSTGCCIVIGALILPSKLTLDYTSFSAVFLTVPLLAAGAVFARWRGKEQAALLLEVLCSGITLSVVVLLASYLAISLNHPLVDSLLANADQRLGFNASYIVSLVNRVPVLSSILMYSYSSFSVQLLVLPILLVASRLPASAFMLVLSYGFVGLAACLISVWFPAVGSHVTYDIASQHLPSVNLHYGYAFLAEFNAVREQSHFTVSLARAQGILTFPSVHTAVAVLCAVAGFKQRFLRYPMIALNLLMVASTVSHGGHYLVDVIAGIALASLALVVASMIARGQAAFVQAPA
jgi:membrane-associated phospholipid phosphatase